MNRSTTDHEVGQETSSHNVTVDVQEAHLGEVPEGGPFQVQDHLHYGAKDEQVEVHVWKNSIDHLIFVRLKCFT